VGRDAWRVDALSPFNARPQLMQNVAVDRFSNAQWGQLNMDCWL
jgi:hypothetical protein